MNNAIHGKTMENLRNRFNVQLVNNKNDYVKYTSRSSHMLQKIFDSNLIAICKSKLALKLSKKIHIRMWILEISKVLMYEFHYDYFKNKYGNKSKLLNSQTLII